jgi:trehalose-phosphatase
MKFLLPGLPFCEAGSRMYIQNIEASVPDCMMLYPLMSAAERLSVLILATGTSCRVVTHLQVCREGAWVENKGAVLTFHYRETPTHLRAELVPQACKLIESHGFKVGSSHCAVEARPPVQWNKGRASIYILRTAFGFDWSERIRIIYAGDDVTDEDAMQASLTSWVSIHSC